MLDGKERLDNARLDAHGSRGRFFFVGERSIVASKGWKRAKWFAKGSFDSPKRKQIVIQVFKPAMSRWQGMLRPGWLSQVHTENQQKQLDQVFHVSVSLIK